MNKKGLEPVVAVAMLLIVSVVTAVGFQTWFSEYSSGIFTSTEQKSTDSVSETKIDNLIGNSLYFRNTNINNISYNKISIGGIDCNLNGTFTSGINEIDISNCLLEVSSITPEVVVYTNDKIYSSKFIIQLGEYCNLDGTNYLSGEYTFYDSSNSYDSACSSQTRTCSNGAFNGSSSYNYTSCTYHPDLMGDGSAISFGQGPSAWDGGWTPSKLNNNVFGHESPINTAPGFTSTSGSGLHINRGVTVTFNRSVAIKHLRLYSYGNTAATQYTVQANTGSWTTVYTHSPTTPNPNLMYFNSDGSVSASQWRYYISGYSGGSNYYLFELQMFE